MKYQLTEKEYQDLIQTKQHEIEISQLHKEIIALETSVSMVQIKLKLQNKQECNNLSFEELNTLQSYLIHKSSEIIASTINNCNIKIPLSDRIPIKYYDDWKGLMPTKLAGIKNNGKNLMIEGKKEIEFLMLDIESIIKIVSFVKNILAENKIQG